jgi:small subunit ribosomal protein S18
MQRRNKRNRFDFIAAKGIEDVNYTDVNLLKMFLSSNLKIKPRRKTGLSARNQRKIANAIKRARIAGLIPFVPR